VCGAKHARVPGREVTRGGTVRGEVVLGGRRVAIRRPRARRVDGGEVRLPVYEAFGREDPLEARAVEQMLVGVATRKYGRSLEPLPASVATRGTSKSAVSRRFVARTRAELEAWARRPLGELDLVALMIDGIGFGDYLLVVALGIDSTGKKHALAIREGSTENASLCRSMLADVVARGVPADRAILVVLDGGTGARSAVRQVFGEYGIVQRCQVHKKRNVVDHLPEHAKLHVGAAMSHAYGLEDYDKAKTQLEKLARSLDEQHPSAAASLREGLDETLTVLRLGIGPALRKSLATTNPIESTFSTVRRVSRRVTRWPSGTMALRWALAGITEAEKTWRRVMGKADMPKLVTALRELDLARATPGTSKRAA
jgi:transposase-like protein